MRRLAFNFGVFIFSEWAVSKSVTWGSPEIDVKAYEGRRKSSLASAPDILTSNASSVATQVIDELPVAARNHLFYQRQKRMTLFQPRFKQTRNWTMTAKTSQYQALCRLR